MIRDFIISADGVNRSALGSAPLHCQLLKHPGIAENALRELPIRVRRHSRCWYAASNHRPGLTAPATSRRYKALARHFQQPPVVLACFPRDAKWVVIRERVEGGAASVTIRSATL